MDDNKKKPEELPQQKLLNKYLEWGVALAGTATGAFLQSSPLKNLVGSESVPTAYGAIVIGVLLMLFISTRKRRILYFTPIRTVVLLLLAITVFEYNRRIVPQITVPYPPDKPWQSIVLKGRYMTESAMRYRRSTQPQPTESEVLWHFNSHIDEVWSPESRVGYQNEVDLLYLAGVGLIGLTIIAAFDTLQGAVKKKPAKRKNQSPPTVTAVEA
jgi:hypothetical protein